MRSINYDLQISRSNNKGQDKVIEDVLLMSFKLNELNDFDRDSLLVVANISGNDIVIDFCDRNVVHASVVVSNVHLEALNFFKTIDTFLFIELVDTQRVIYEVSINFSNQRKAI